MTEKEKMLNGFMYDSSDEELVKLRILARNTAITFNSTTEDEWELRQSILTGILGKLGEDAEINPDIKLDYGCNLYLGDRCYINFNCTFLDCAEIRLKDNVMVGPNVSFLTPVHPMLASERNVRIAPDKHIYTLEYAKPITIEEDVWICANVTILPGVTVGSGSVIGAGSVVTKDIPRNVFAAGNPCKVVREITKDDAVKNYYKE